MRARAASLGNSGKLYQTLLRNEQLRNPDTSYLAKLLISTRSSPHDVGCSRRRLALCCAQSRPAPYRGPGPALLVVNIGDHAQVLTVRDGGEVRRTNVWSTNARRRPLSYVRRRSGT